MAICANCGAELPPHFRFCGACGAPVRVPAEHDVRKVVTVLFCDITDSTGLGEREDPERLRSVLRSYFDSIESVVAGHGGLVEKFIGDAVMAVFGLPAAHEDDALRAVRAAAEVHELPSRLAADTGLELAFRTGINTGEVVAGGGQTLVTGDAVNVAARLEEAAGPGEILLGAKTVRLLGRHVEAELLAPLDVQGKAEPVTAYRFRGLAKSDGPRATPFVGRERELALLADGFRRAAEERELHLFTLLGPAGIGKSRLASEFVDAVAPEAGVAHGRCLSYGKGITYWPLVEILRGLGEPAAPALELVIAGGATSSQQLAWTVQQALELTAGEKPLVVVVEDLHWAEPALLDLLDLVCELSRGAAIFMLCVARPELLEQRLSWGGGKPNATSILLEPLVDSDCEVLLDGLEQPLDAAQRERALEVAAGNPLFLEEVSAFVAEGGGVDELPPRIHALLQARLDLLPEPEWHVLACAAVAGTVVHRGGLEALVGEEIARELPLHLADLTRRWLIRPAGAELAGEEGFRFRHQLIRDVAYGALSKEERARLHERFADWLEVQSGEREELHELEAYHLEQAALSKRELGAGDPTLEARAGSALATAGERARGRPDLRAAVGLWRRALALLESDDPRVPELELQLALALGALGRFDEEQLLVEQAAQHTDDPVVTANVRLVRLQMAGLLGSEDVLAAIRHECAQAIPLFEDRGDHRSVARAWWTLAGAEVKELNVEAAAQSLANAAAQARLTGDRAREAGALCERLRHLGLLCIPFPTAVREYEELATEFPGEPWIEFDLGTFRALAAYDAGRTEQARRFAHDTLDVLRRAGFTMMAAFGAALFGWHEALNGDLEEGERLALPGLRELQEHGATAFLAWALPYLADIRVLQGRYAEALRLADTAQEQGGAHDRITIIHANSVRARAQAHVGAIEEARAAAATALSAAGTTDSPVMKAVAQHALAETLDAAGELPPALAAAREAARLCTIAQRNLLERRARALAEQIEQNLARAGARTSVA